VRSVTLFPPRCPHAGVVSPHWGGPVRHTAAG